MLREVAKLMGDEASDAVFAYGHPRSGAAAYADQPESAQLRVRAAIVQTAQVVTVGADPVATVTHRVVRYATRDPEAVTRQSWRVRMLCCPEAVTSDCRDHAEAHDWAAHHMTQCRGAL